MISGLQQKKDLVRWAARRRGQTNGKESGRRRCRRISGKVVLVKSGQLRQVLRSEIHRVAGQKWSKKDPED